jgi:hypothetical protein
VPGAYTVEVSSHNVASGPQGLALVVTHGSDKPYVASPPQCCASCAATPITAAQVCKARQCGSVEGPADCGMITCGVCGDAHQVGSITCSRICKSLLSFYPLFIQSRSLLSIIVSLSLLPNTHLHSLLFLTLPGVWCRERSLRRQIRHRASEWFSRCWRRVGGNCR